MKTNSGAIRIRSAICLSQRSWKAQFAHPSSTHAAKWTAFCLKTGPYGDHDSSLILSRES